MGEEKKIPETFIVVDTSYLDFISNDVKQNFERILARPLPSFDLVGLLTWLSMDAGAQTAKSGSDVLFLSDLSDVHIRNCEPENLRQTLDGKACMTEIGEMTFAFSNTEGFTTLKDLFSDTANHLCKIKGLKRIALVASDSELDEMTPELLKNKPENVDIVMFRMDRKEPEGSIRHELLIYPLLKAFGVRSEELR